MKKGFSIFVVFIICSFKLANAQVLTVSGSVKDDSGNTVPLAFVQDKSDRTATRTDSLGRFTLKANANATLLVTSAGYETKLIDVKGKTDIIVVLTTDKGTAANVTVTTPAAFSDYTASHGVGNSLMYGAVASGALLPVFHPVEETRGSRYLFTDWAPGLVISPEDSVYKNPKYGFNYDKINGSLLLTEDKHSAIEIDPGKIKSFTLYNNLNQPEVFEYVPEINKTHFPQVIESGAKYRIYKLTTTKFVKNNFHSDGMTSTGNNYDEYVDESAYYVLNVQSKRVQELKPKKKSIKAVFANEGKKLDTFFDTYSGNIDDTYLKNLGDYMNQ
jgi:hypothetical protein